MRPALPSSVGLGLVCVLGPVCMLDMAACTRVSANLSGLEDADRPDTGRAKRDTARRRAIPGECDPAELRACAHACFDSDCLEWCGGSSCVASLAILSTCMDTGEQRFNSEHPVPEPEFETEIEDGVEYQVPTEASLEREYAYEEAYATTLDEHWQGACAPRCVELLMTDASPSFDFCSDWRDSYDQWAALTKPKPKPESSKELRILGVLGSEAGMLGILWAGTSMAVNGELAGGSGDDQSQALRRLVSDASTQLRGAEDCVPGLDPDGREFVIAVAIDPEGGITVHSVDDSSDDGACIADHVTAALALPVRVAQTFPRFEVRVQVRPQTDDFGLGLGPALDGLDGYDGYEGDEWGGWGEGGLGGGGGGGGGTGEGIGGLGGSGTIGGFGPAPEPEPEPQPEPQPDGVQP